MSFWIPLIIIFVFISVVVALLFFRAKTDSASRTPEWLANQILRFPERMLIDIPIFASSFPQESRFDTLILVDNELESVGKLEIRRQFLKHFAEMFEHPSADSLYSLTNFLFCDSSEEFRETLHWDSNCEAAMQYLKSLHDLVDFSRKNASPNEIRQAFKRIKPIVHVPKELVGQDKKVIQEWVKLNRSLNYAILPKNLRGQKGKKGSSRGRKIRNQRRGANNKSSPSHKIERESVFHLESFQSVAIELFQITFANHGK